jgi:hypothetical protein
MRESFPSYQSITSRSSGRDGECLVTHHWHRTRTPTEETKCCLRVELVQPASRHGDATALGAVGRVLGGRSGERDFGEVRLRDEVGNTEVAEEGGEIRGWAADAVEAGSREGFQGCARALFQTWEVEESEMAAIDMLVVCPGGHETPSVKGTLPV